MSGVLGGPRFLWMGLALAGAVVSAQAAEAPAKKTPAGPPYASAILMEASSGVVLFEHNPRDQRPPASMAKMMLMLIVAEKVARGQMKWSDQIAASEEAASMGGSQVFLKPGESFPLHELMQAIVIHSANDASVAVAEAVAGSREQFVELMNERAKELGLKGTTYHTPHGLPPAAGQESDMTTAYDLAVLARELLKHREIMGWADTAETTFRAGSFQLMNTNHLVRTTPWVTGLKTGYTREAGFNVTATAERDSLRLIAVVMGSPTKKPCFAEAARLLNKGFAGYQPMFAVRKGDVVANDVPVLNGEPRFVRIVAGENLSIVAQKGVKRNFSLELAMPAELQAPLEAATAVGAVVVREDGREIGQVPALTADAVSKQPRFWERFF